MEKKLIKVGFIGCGEIANAKHLPALAKVERCEVVAFCDIIRERAEETAKRFGTADAKVYTDYKQLLKDESIDVVHVCTPNRSHSFITVDALEAGKHVMCEKPMAINSAEAKKMLDAAERTGKLLTIGYQNRFRTDSTDLKQEAEDGVFGDIYYAKATYLRRSGCPGGWFGDKSRSGGGPLIDLGVHVIDLVRYLAGSPKAVSAYGVTFNNLGPDRASGKKEWQVEGNGDPYTVEDFTTALIRFDNGFTVSVEASFNLNIKKDVGNIELFGTNAGCTINPDLELFTQIAGKFVNVKPCDSIALEFNGLFEREIKGFVDAVNGDAPCIATAEDGVELMRIIDAIYESAETGRSVEITR